MSPVDNSSTPISTSTSSPHIRISGCAASSARTSPSRSLALRRAMHALAFVPRPFPPPNLADVPLEYIIDQLRRLAPHYWSKPESSDCTIIVPLAIDRTQITSGHHVPGSPDFLRLSSMMSSESVGQGKPSKPALRSAPRMVMKLHMDYLCAHSSLLRGLLGGASPFDLISASNSSHLSNPSRPTSPSCTVPRTAPVPALHIPCLLPSSTPTHPNIYLPVPDPTSIRLLVHYIYFGSTSFIEDALDRGELAWEGVVRNVEYLGMGADIKVFLGRWYARWRHRRSSEDYGSDYSESDSEQESDDGRDTADESTSATLLDDDEDRMCIVGDEDDPALAKVKACARAPPRGRNTQPRRLGHSSSDPGFSHRIPTSYIPQIPKCFVLYRTDGRTDSDILPDCFK
ncbi:hypothetical protein A0H81_14355 [Grifola frondosa]|uniref:Uncharacterized protein n=1 Tax=Grifola frondosa TaxID=5627 RepID=A0A1C7LME4_GRIFR|nr:hypothetical protein A0H81_14355 [Grifola frondosa]